VTETTGLVMTDVDQEVSTNIVQITHCISSNPTFV